MALNQPTEALIKAPIVCCQKTKEKPSTAYTVTDHVMRPFINGKFKYINRYVPGGSFSNDANFARELRVNKDDLSYVGEHSTVKLVAYYVYLTYYNTKDLYHLSKILDIYSYNFNCIVEHLVKIDNHKYNTLFQIDKLQFITRYITDDCVSIKMAYDLLIALKNLVQILHDDRPEMRLPIVDRIINQIRHYIAVTKRINK
jgi:hypothetical protein